MSHRIGDLILSREVDYNGVTYKNVLGQVSNIIYEIDWINPELETIEKTKLNCTDIQCGKNNVKSILG